MARAMQGKAMPVSRRHSLSAGYSGPTGNLVEIFSGIQGEGIHVGERHLFVRLAGCDFNCDYCDQPEAKKVPKHFTAECSAGRRDFTKYPNPVDAGRAVVLIRTLWKDTPHRLLALTGGEPLMQPKFLSALLPSLRQDGIPVLLETNGSRPRELRMLLALFDVVSMDLKLRSATGRPFPRKKHEQFIGIAASAGLSLYSKIVVTSKTSDKEITEAARLVARAGSEIPFVIQPLTSGRRRDGMPPSPGQLLRLQEVAAEILQDVRVIPQTHKMIGQR